MRQRFKFKKKKHLPHNDLKSLPLQVFVVKFWGIGDGDGKTGILIAFCRYDIERFRIVDRWTAETNQTDIVRSMYSLRI